MSYLRYLCLLGSSLPPVVVQEGVCLIYVICVCLVRLYLQLLYRRAYMSYIRYLCLFERCSTHIVLCFCVVWSSSCVPYVAVVSLDCPFVIALSIFSNVYIVYIILLINNTRYLPIEFLDQHCGDVYQ